MTRPRAAGAVLGVNLERVELADGSGDEWRIVVTRVSPRGNAVAKPHGQPVDSLWEAASLAGDIKEGA